MGKVYTTKNEDQRFYEDVEEISFFVNLTRQIRGQKPKTKKEIGDVHRRHLIEAKATREKVRMMRELKSSLRDLGTEKQKR